MKNILINAYAICPNKGSEPGMGWNWILNISRYHKVFVITEAEFKQQITEGLKEVPHRENIKIFYNDIGEKARKMCWNQGDYRFYYYYAKWQKKTLEIAEQIVAANKIDLIHQLNMVGYREPGYLWKIDHIPFIWGPVAGYGYFPLAYTRNAGMKMVLFLRLKNILNYLQANYSPRVLQAAKKARILVGANNDAVNALKMYKNEKSVFLINETGSNLSVEEELVTQERFRDDAHFDILWVGRFIYSKQLGLALHAISKLKHLKGLKFHIIGGGNPVQNAHYRKVAEELGIENLCIWHGEIPNKEVHKKMREAHLFFFTSVMEATSTVVLEAISNGLPILSFNTCGFGSIIDESIGDKIELSSVDQSIDEFADKIEYLYNNREALSKKSARCIIKRDELSWNAKAKDMVALYEKAIFVNHSKTLASSEQAI